MMKLLQSLLKISSRFVVFALGLFLGQTLPAQVNFTVTPAAVSNQYAGSITLQITGLINGESVKIGKYLDANTNGVVDAGDLLVEGVRLTDGQAMVIGGVTNINVPGDLDSNGTNGAITWVWSFPASGIEQRGVGQYIFRLSSPTNRFPATNVLFNVTNTAYAQSISGTVLNGASPVANAGVLVFPGASLNGGPVAGVVADNSGNYMIKVAPGNYTLWAFKSNYVADASAAAVVTLGPGATPTTNLYLLSATPSISGQITYAGTNVGLVGLLVICQSTNNLLALGFTDTNGNFSVPVLAGQWKLSTENQQLPAYACLDLQNTPSFDTTTGSVAGVSIGLPRGTALFYGTVKDDQNQPLVGLTGYADDDGHLYEGSGTTDQNGYYVIAVIAGNWQLEANNSGPLFAHYVFPQSPGSISITNGQAIQLNILAIRATNLITGYVRDNGSNPIVGVGVQATANLNGTNYQQYTHTDGSGNFALNVPNGNWSVSLNCGSGDNDDLSNFGSYQCPDPQSTNILNSNGIVNFTVQPCGPPQVTTASPLPDGQANSFYQTQLQASGCNPPFNWSLRTNSGPLPPGLVLASNGNLSGTPTNQGTFNFVVRVLDSATNFADQAFSLTINPSGPSPLQITTASLPDGTNGVFYSQLLSATGGQPPYQWSLTPGSGSLPPGLSLATNGVLSGTPTASANFSFSVRVTDDVTATADQLLGLTINTSASSPVFSLYSFNGGDGAHPNGLMQAGDGVFYGTTRYGSTNDYGTVFKVTPFGFLTSMYSFSGIDGAQPAAGLVQGRDGGFYGTTYYGGAFYDSEGHTFGTVFKIMTNGVFTSFYSFSRMDGANPDGRLVQGADGNLYGTTALGGPNFFLDDGTVFKITTNGVFTSMNLFYGGNGIEPEGGLVQAADGYLYGTTFYGGTHGVSDGGYGTVFKMATNGALNSLYSFTGGNDGRGPGAELVQGTDGNLYGTTQTGGTNDFGAIFKMTPGGTFTPLYSFTGGNDGGHPDGGLVQGTDGNFYGTTYDHGANSYGTVFRMTPGGALATQYSFTGGSDGANPVGALVQGTNGSFYGVTYNGGMSGNGTIFRLDLGPPPAPVFRSVAKSGGTITLTWSAVAGLSYQLQYKTNLSQIAWNNLGSAVTATNSTAIATDSIGPDPRRFYRVKLGP